jgi:hypothetical protein
MVAVVSQDTAFSLLDNSTSVLNIRLLINKLSQFRHGPNSPSRVLVLASQILLRAHRAYQAEKGVPWQPPEDQYHRFTAAMLMLT